MWRSEVLGAGSTLGDLLAERAAHFPNVVGYRFLKYTSNVSPEVEQITYGELLIRARAIAKALQTSCSKDDRVVIVCPPGIDYITAFFACQLGGFTAVPAYPPRNARHMGRLELILDDAQATAVLATSRLADRLSNWTADGLPPILAVDAISDRGAAGWSAPGIIGRDLAFLQYTSGTTGVPKGVMIQHVHALDNIQRIIALLDLDEKSAGAFWLPPYHDMGLIGTILVPLAAGYCSTLMSPAAFLQRPLRWIEALSETGSTITTAPNFAWQLCTDKIKPSDLNGIDLSNLRHAFLGAETVRAETLDAFAEHFADTGFSRDRFVPAYGMAETVLLASGTSGRAPVERVLDEAIRTYAGKGSSAPDTAEEVATGWTQSARRVVSCGSVISDHAVRIVDPHELREVPTGRIGEIWLSGPSVAAGYWNQPERTADTFHAKLSGSPEKGTWLRTGDLGALVDGELHVLGRIKETIIVRGVNHYAVDIEATVAMSHDGLKVDRAAAFSVDTAPNAQDQPGVEQLVIVQELDRAGLRMLDMQQVFEAIRRTVLEVHEVEPHAIVLVKPTTLPRTTSGKIQRLEARRRFSARELAEVDRWVATEEKVSAAPFAGDLRDKATLENWLRELIASAIGSPAWRVPLDQGLFELGIDSLKAAQLAETIARTTGQALDPSAIYETPTIKALASRLADGSPAARPPIWAKARGLDPATPIAVVGQACRFPGAPDTAAFWKLLMEGNHAIGPVESARWASTISYKEREDTRTKAGLIEGADQFDAAFFRIPPVEARLIDPQQRLLLETSWTAIESAGIAADSLSGTRGAVYLGISSQDYGTLLSEEDDLTAPHRGTGTANSVAAGRVAYVLGLQGPAVAIDTACSSSLVAIHEACKSLRLGEAEFALAGGVNVIASPLPTEVFTRAGMLSDTGACRPFDAGADGYVRGEGCGVVVLKRLADAEAQGDPILAVLRGSAINQDGAAAGLTVPSASAQQRVIQDALSQAGLAPADVDYLEAHGTGTRLGDPIEVRAAATAYGRIGTASDPLLIGSVKGNIGHLEAAAGIAGFIKSVLCLHHGVVPGQRNFERPSPHIDWDALDVAVVVEPTRFSMSETRGRPARVAVSSFGFSGTNAHAVLEAYQAGSISDPGRIVPPERLSAPANVSAEALQEAAQTVRPRPFRVLPISGKSTAALKDLAGSYAHWIKTELRSEKSEGDRDLTKLLDGAYTAGVGRSHLPYREGLVFGNEKELEKALEGLVASDARPQASTFRQSNKADGASSASGRAAFLFTGQASQWAGMGLGLYDTEPVARAVLDRCDSVMRTFRDISLTEAMFEVAAEARRLEDTALAQPALFALQAAIVAQWQSLGVRPVAVLGHSVGEIAAAYTAGMMTLEEGLRLSAVRGELMGSLPSEGPLAGAMAAVFAPAGQVIALLERHNAKRPAGGALSHAADNGAHQIVSGPATSITLLSEDLKKRAIRIEGLRTSHAFHSGLMDPILDALEEAAPQTCTPTGTTTLISTVTGAVLNEGDRLDRSHWRRHARDPVRFASGLAALSDFDIGLVIEIGPDAVLAPLASLSWPNQEKCPAIIASQRRQAPRAEDTEDLLADRDVVSAAGARNFAEAVAAAYAAGADLTFESLFTGEPRSRIQLPTYPFQTKRYWIDPPERPPNREIENSESAVADIRYQASGSDALSGTLASNNILSSPSASARAGARLPLNGAVTTRMNPIEETYNPKATTEAAVITTLVEVTGYPESEIRGAENLFALGLDSILIVAVMSRLNEALGLSISAIDILQTNRSFKELVAFLDEQRGSLLPPHQAPRQVPDPDMSSRDQIVRTEKSQSTLFASRIPDTQAPSHAKSGLFESQFRLREGNSSSRHSAGAPDPGSTKKSADMAHLRSPSNSPPKQETTVQDARALSAGSPSPPKSSSEKVHLNRLSKGYFSKTRRSKELSARNRDVHASLRNRVGFRLETKEFQYPISFKNSKGAHLWDIDGNRYVDIVMGFGVNLFGHHPGFIRAALQEEMDSQTPLVASSSKVGEVAGLIAELTGVERVSFFSTGSEAVMVAVRIARAATDRKKIVIFERSYHGHADSVVPVLLGYVRGSLGASMSPGSSDTEMADVLVLPYGGEEALEKIRRHADEIACVLVEPVQSRDPANQPGAFLRDLRALTRQHGVALVFDEVITGFRTAQGGAQEIFGIAADLVVYGKVAGGGMPIGIVAGSAQYMAFLDGGLWSFGDESQPNLNTIVAAGTFNNHPLSIAAARAVMKHLKTEGPDLQERLSLRTERLCAALDDLFQHERAPISISRFRSMFRFEPRLQRDLFRLNLLSQGIHYLEASCSFLSTEHSDADIEAVISAVDQTIWAFKRDGVITVPKSRQGRAYGEVDPKPNRSIDRSKRWHAHEALVRLTSSLPDAALAHRETLAIELRGPLETGVLADAFDQIVARHEVLSSLASDRSSSGAPAQVPRLALERAKDRDAILSSIGSGVPDLSGSQTDGIFQARLLQFGPAEHILVLVCDHGVLDGWSISLFLREMAELYNARLEHRPANLSEADDYISFVKWADALDTGDASDAVSNRMLRVPLGAGMKSQSRYDGGRLTCTIDRKQDPGDPDSEAGLLAARLAVSPTAIYLAAYAVLIARLSNRKDVVIGVPFAGQIAADMPNLIGPVTAVVPIEAVIDANDSFALLIRRLHQGLADSLSSVSRAFSDQTQDKPDVLFNVDQGGDLRLKRIALKRIPLGRKHVTHGLSLNLQRSPSSLQIDLDWNARFLTEEDAGRWLATYLSVLNAGVHDPDTEVGSLRLSTADRDAQRSTGDLRTVDALGTAAAIGVIARVEERNPHGGWQPTTQIGRLGSDGLVEVLGPADKVFHNAVAWIDARHIDQVLQNEPGVVACETLLIRGDRDQREIVCFVTVGSSSHSESGIDNTEVLDLRDRIDLSSIEEKLKVVVPAGALPNRFVGLSRMPKDRDGAVDKAGLTAVFEANRSVLEETNRSPRGFISDLFRRYLNCKAFNRHDSFFDLGGTSLSALRLLADVERGTGKRIAVARFFNHPTVDGIEAALEKKKPSTDQTASRIEADVRLARKVKRPSTSVTADESKAHVLLTGATGFLGRYILKALLGTDVGRIYCLCRGSSETVAQQRLIEALGKADADCRNAGPRVQIAMGDLSRPRLGLAPDAFEEIASSCNAILHVGADVSFAKQYEGLRSINVLSVIEMLGLCAHRRPKTLHFVSTLGVFGYSEYQRPTPGTVPELHGLDTGYAQSKWAAERILLEAEKRGFSVQITRPAQILGDAATGSYENADIATALLELICDVGCIPDFPHLRIPVINVDHAAQQIVRNVAAKSPIERIVHLADDDGLSVSDIVEIAANAGITVETVTLRAFLSRASDFIHQNPEHVGSWVMRLINDRVQSLPRAISTYALSDRSSVRRGLDGGRAKLLPGRLNEELLAPLHWRLKQRAESRSQGVQNRV